MTAPTYDRQTEEAHGESSPVSWPHFGGMLVLIAGTVGFWALLYKHLKAENRKGPR